LAAEAKSFQLFSTQTGPEPSFGIGGSGAQVAGERRDHLRILTFSKCRHHPPPVDARASPTSPSRGEAPRFSVKRKKLAEIFPPKSARPLTLLPIPEPIEAIAPVPDDPPLSFLWRRIRRRVAFADGPERIGPEWWLPAQGRARDYYRVEDAQGRRYWLYREGLYGATEPPRWFLHGFFP
jgi:protein ImuB